MSNWQDMPLVGQIPSDWTWAYLGKICEYSQYGLNSASGEGDAYPLLKMNNLQDGAIDTSDLTYVNLTPKELNAYKLEIDDLLINRTNSADLVGKVALFELLGDYVFASYLVRFRFNRELVHPKFVHYFLNSVTGKAILQSFATKGVSQANLNPTTLKNNLPIPLPPLAEQRQIAAILSTWDEAITLTEQLIDALQRRKQALMQLLLTGAVRFPEFDGEWEEDILENCCEILDSLRKPLNSEERSQRRGNIPYWGANGVIDFIDDFIFDEPLIIMAEDGGYFEEARERPICQLVDGKSWINNHAHVLRANARAIREWIYYWFVHRDITPYINAGTRSKLNQSELRKLPIQIPTTNEQQKISQMLANCDDAIGHYDRLVTCFLGQKRGLMQQLLTGAVRVQV